MSFDIHDTNKDSRSYNVTFHVNKGYAAVQFTFDWENDPDYIPEVLRCLRENRDFRAPTKQNFVVEDKQITIYATDIHGIHVGAAAFPTKLFISLVERINEMSRNKEFSLENFDPLYPKR